MNTISRDELRRKLDRGERFELVMTLSAFAYETKHIPGSRRFESSEQMLAVLDPDDDIVVYCSAVYCPSSIWTYRLLERRGYTHVRRYEGGVVEWEEAGYPLERGSSPGQVARRRRVTRRGIPRLDPAFT
jgi:rhodanese-related sulfurtransferase